MSAILDFYRDQPNPSGYTFLDVMGWNDNEWEMTHDFIQWLFPMPEASMFNADAPVLTKEDTLIFTIDPDLRERLLQALSRFAKFLGLKYHWNDQQMREEVENHKVWKYQNHNWLRITRCLRSLRYLGHEYLAQAFFKCLSELYNKHKAITPTTFEYWQQAVQGPLEKLPLEYGNENPQGDEEGQGQGESD